MSAAQLPMSLDAQQNAAANRSVAADGITSTLVQKDSTGHSLSRAHGAHTGLGNLALMGVGATAVAIGLLIGGSGGAAITASGGALSLAGLYRYLRPDRRTVGRFHDSLAWRSFAVDHWARRWLGPWTVGSRAHDQARLTQSPRDRFVDDGGWWEIAGPRSRATQRLMSGLQPFWWR